MIVALTGATGFLGSAIARELVRNDHEVVGLARASSSRDHLDGLITRFVIGDHADPAIWAELLDGADAVVHNSFDWEALKSGNLRRHLESNLHGSLMLLEAAHERGVERFIFMSSVAVHHEISDRWNGVIDEDHPLRPGGRYGACKAAVESHLWSARAAWGMHTASIRPAAVYGVEPVRLERSHGHRQVVRLIEGGRIMPEEFPGGGKWVHVDDVALATVRALERPDAAGRAFHLTDCYAKFTRLGEHAAALLGLPPDRVEPDASPPARNRFDTAPTERILGVPLDRGDAGLREFIGELIDAIRVGDRPVAP